jgi:beta-glucan synthesis-associated protein KRE6
MGPDPTVEISARPVPQEPMVSLSSFGYLRPRINPNYGFSSPKYIIINLGMSENFGAIDFDHLTFPTHMRVDYIRVYQDIRHINVGCDPKGYPTLDYINKFVETTQ